MKSKIMFYIKTIALGMATFLPVSCSDTLTGVERSNKKVSVPLSVSTTGNASSHAIQGAKDGIKSLHILAFTGNPTDMKQAELVYVVKATLQEGNKFVADFFKSQNNQDLYRLVVLANADDGKMANLPVGSGSTYADISGLLHEDARQRYSPDAPVGMFGVANGGKGIMITEGMSLESIKLIRDVSRIDIGVGNYNEETGKWDLTPPPGNKYFQLTDVEAWSPMNRNFNMPAADKFNYEPDKTPIVTGATNDLLHSATTAVKWIYNNEASNSDIQSNGIATYCKDVIYLPEAPLQGYTAHQPENMNRRTALIIGGFLHDPNLPEATMTKTWYRVDFTKAAANTPDGALFDILRNHQYRISLDVQASGAATAIEAWNASAPTIDQITVKVAEWQDGGSVDTPVNTTIRIDNPHSTLPDNVHITAWDNTIHVSKSGGELSLAFSAETAVEIGNNMVNPSSGRLSITRTGAEVPLDQPDQIVTRFNIKVKPQETGHEKYTVEVPLKFPFQTNSYYRFAISVEPSDKQYAVATLGGRTWMAFNSRGKGNGVQLYLDPDVTVEQMYETRWVETLGLQFQFGRKTGYVPWQIPNGRGGWGPDWNQQADEIPCPDGYRVPTQGELNALFPKGDLAVTTPPTEYTYRYNDDMITAVIKTGQGPGFFPDTNPPIPFLAYYIALTSQKTGDVLYIPFGGWKKSNLANPNSPDGVAFWTAGFGGGDSRRPVIKRKGNESVWQSSLFFVDQNSYVYMRCIKQ